MKKLFKNKLSYISSIIGLIVTTSVSAQVKTNPIGMQYVGSQNYYGQNTMIMPPQQKMVAPAINSIYATPMHRINEIPLYGKNKHTYFYGQKKKEEGPFRDSGLYLFASFSTGKANEGINAEKSIFDDDGSYLGGADKNDEMGTANGFTIGVGRVMSNTLSVEFMYSSYNGMKYGDFAKFENVEEIEEEILDPETGEPTGDYEYIENYYIDETTYEVIDGGGISSNFIGLGFKYNLDNVFGMLGGRLKPYFGFQLGIAQNTIKDYTILDADGYMTGDEDPYEYLDLEDSEYTLEDISHCTYDDPCYSTTFYNGEITSIGKTTRTFGAGIEAGFSVELEGDLQLDIFYKMNMYGKIKTSGNTLSVYNKDETEYYIVSNEEITDDTNPCSGDDFITSDADYTLCSYTYDTEYDVQDKNERHVESGDMIFHQYGIKLKYMF